MLPLASPALRYSFAGVRATVMESGCRWRKLWLGSLWWLLFLTRGIKWDVDLLKLLTLILTQMVVLNGDLSGRRLGGRDLERLMSVVLGWLLFKVLLRVLWDNHIRYLTLSLRLFRCRRPWRGPLCLPLLLILVLLFVWDARLGWVCTSSDQVWVELEQLVPVLNRCHESIANHRRATYTLSAPIVEHHHISFTSNLVAVVRWWDHFWEIL